MTIKTPWKNPPRDKNDLDERDYKLMSLPLRYRQAEFELIPIGALKDRVELYLRNIRNMRDKGVGMALFGNNGIGKTMAMTIILRAMYLHAQSVLFVSAFDLVGASIDDSIRYSPDYSLWDYSHRADVLLLDELGDESSTRSGYDKASINSLIRKRYNNKKVTLITTNNNVQEFIKSYKESMCRVILDNSICVEMKDADNVRRTNFYNEISQLNEDE